MITIDLDSKEPLFSQLINQIKKAVETKKLSPGDALPSIRQLANELELNSKTVAKAYSLLERDNVIESKGYRGTFVHPQAPKNVQVDINDWLNEQMQLDVARYRKAGATDSEIRIAFTNAVSQTGN
ncbi:GntR family transcriptional regulator [Glaciecola petra]|uniref:GntR family transcriptional regulator n=1 Tax=Glaciecola petra TaxID=3075602 RepID=A0ABU2ZVY7_9ALTE|nr:GntR family transcriptional regulator [Aestuariibacter sp. P117]MDT0595744.1 GntR family transcriptional regulator [Aestuariibacter sp. P117]